MNSSMQTISYSHHSTSRDKIMQDVKYSNLHKNDYANLCKFSNKLCNSVKKT